MATGRPFNVGLYGDFSLFYTGANRGGTQDIVLIRDLLKEFLCLPYRFLYTVRCRK